MMNRKYLDRVTNLLLVLGFSSCFVHGSELTVPNGFADGQATNASEMNANFDAIEAAVNDNNVRIESLINPANQASIFQGFSAVTTTGGVGIYTMQQTCDGFVSGSTVCYMEEVANSPYSSSVAATLEDTQQAWVKTRPSGQTFLESSDHYYNCGNWGDVYVGQTGATVSPSLVPSFESCAVSRPIACCK
jgi:hypothetical protein